MTPYNSQWRGHTPAQLKGCIHPTKAESSRHQLNLLFTFEVILTASAIKPEGIAGVYKH